MYMDILISTSQTQEVLDITDFVQKRVSAPAKACLLTTLHTTCALTTADLDPGTDEDLLEFLEKITPQANWRHPHNPAHAPAHLLSSLIGPSVVVPINDGKLQLGTWQRIVLVELDGPRERTISVITL